MKTFLIFEIDVELGTDGTYGDDDFLEEIDFNTLKEVKEYANEKYGEGNTCIRWVRKNGNIGVGEYERF
ncbi:MAG: hypothetical protein RR904_05545 [Bacilli bacterium]